MSAIIRPFLGKRLPNHLGFTLIELMVAIAIAAILLGIAIPSFTTTITSNRLTTNANEMVTALNLARSEAIKRGKQVTVRSKNASTSWEGGWDVFVDVDASNAFNDDGDATLCEATEDCLLRTYAALPSGYTLRTPSSRFQTYLPTGLSSVVAGDTFTLCSGSGSAMTRRTITITLTGRPSTAVTTGTCP